MKFINNKKARYQVVALLLSAVFITACNGNESSGDVVISSDSSTTITTSDITQTTIATIPSTTEPSATAPITVVTTRPVTPPTETTPITEESKTQATTQPQETSEIEGLTQLLTDDDFTFVNDFGDNMDIRYADLIWFDYDHYIEPEEMFKENYYTIIYNQFTYLTKSLGVSYNSIDDPFDYENQIFNVEVPEQNYDWFKVYPGDKFGPLTVEETRVDYDYFEGKVYDGDFRVKFSGSLTVTGYINCIIKDGGFVGKGDIIFCVDAETWGDIPIMMRKGISANLPNVRYKAEMDDFRYSSDIGAIKLGNVYRDDYSDVDLGLIPDDGSYRHVTVKLTDLNMSITTRSDGGGYYAKIESISLLDE